MGLFNSIRLGSSAAGAYEVEKSLRINKPDNPQLYRTGSNNADTFTISMWIKIGRLYTTYRRLFSSYADGLVLNNDHRLRYSDEGDGSFYSTAKFRDPSAWYHIVMAVNTSGTTVYVNNVTHITSSSKFSLSTSSNAIKHFWHAGDPSEFTFDGYGADVALIDGQALTPSSFAETDALTGQWIPKDLSSLTFGSNGHWLKFTDSTNIGKDFSGNSNDFTTANFSVSAGAGNDSLEDTPTNNFCTLNPLDKMGTVTVSEGNLKVVINGDNASLVTGSFGVSSGKWYYEAVVDTAGAGFVGWIRPDVSSYTSYPYQQSGSLIYHINGSLYKDGAGGQSYGVSYTNGDIIGCAINLDDNQVTFYKNNSSQGTVSITAGTYNPNATTGGSSATFTFNFGQRAFSYTPPTGYKKICSANLPDPTIKLPAQHFNTLLYTGNDSNDRDITGVGFQPDFTWIKNRSQADWHMLQDSVRGANKVLYSNTGDGEEPDNSNGHVNSFLADGFNVDAGASGNVNENGENYVAWNWKGGGSASSNSDGSLTSSVSANTTAGFSIGTYTGQSSGSATVGHGLGVAPDVVITKSRTSSSNWYIYHKSIGQDGWIILDSNGAATTGNSAVWNPAPTSSVFTYGSGLVNQGDIVFYAFSEVAGYSKFGSYTGNGSSDGTFVYTEFRPALIISKKSSGTDSWQLWDNKRDPDNLMHHRLFGNESSVETTSVNSASSQLDFYSNGFKWRGSSNDTNGNGDTYIYLAFAESPFKYSRAR